MESQILVGGEEEPTEIESLCMNCRENGITKLLPMSIPYFRDVMLMAFECPHCGVRNSEVQSTGVIQEMGKMFILHANKPEV